MLDVAIIGAGAAGLGAARAAKARGFSFRVLEAASFTGGRARTDKTRLGVPFDVGCRSLYGGEDNPFYVFARDMESELEPVAENIAFFDGGRFLDTWETQAAIVDFERLESDLIGAHTGFVEAAGVADRSQAEVIDSSCIAVDYFRQAIHIEFTAAAEVISLADPMHRVLATSGEAVIDGYGALIQRVCADIPVDTNCPVSAIELSGRDVVLDTPKGRVAARTVIVTASTAVLAAERIALRPNGWPNRKLAAIDSLPMGSVTQIGFRLRPGALPEEFVQEQEDGMKRSMVYCLMNEPRNLFWLLGAGRGDLAIAYLGGEFSRELALQGEASQADWALQQLVDLFGNSIRDLVTGSCATPFDREPWIGGGYAYCRYGSGNHRPALAEPIDNRVFFAGEACSQNHPGTAHGAWLSGVDAIESIVAQH